jgi:hypothetical protein
MSREYSTNGEESGAYRILVGKPEGKKLLGRSRREKKIKIVSVLNYLSTTP